MTARTSTGAPRDGPTLSRRALLFGLPGLGRRGLDRAAAEECIARPAGPAVAWDAGDYAAIARRLAPAADTLVRACAVAPGQAWLDVAAGDGNFALAAARAGAEVVAVDSAPALLARGRARAEARGLAVDWRAGTSHASR